MTMAGSISSLFLICISAIMISCDHADPYYGVPIGSLVDNNEGGSHGDVYAADSKTLTIVNLRNSQDPKCTSFIAGQISKTQSMQSASKIGSQTRAKRQSGFALRDGKLVPQIQALNPNAHPLDWPFEFGHLTVEEGSESSSGKKIQDPFDVELSNGEDEEQNSTQSTSTPDAEITLDLAQGSTGTPHPAPITRIKTVSPAEDEKTTSPGPLLTLPPPASFSTPASGSSAKASSVPTSTIETINLSSIVLHSKIEEINETESGAEVTTPPESDDSTSEPPPILTEVDDDTSFEDSESGSPATERKALWTRPTTPPVDIKEGEGESLASVDEAENGTTSTSTPKSQKGSSPKPKSKKQHKTETDAPAATKSPSSKGDQSKQSSNQQPQQQKQWQRPVDPPGQASSPKTEQQSSGGLVWLGASAPSEQPSNRGSYQPQLATQFPPGRPGKNIANRPVSVLRQLPVEYFGGLNVPDELEGKNGTNPGQPIGQGQSGGFASNQQNGDSDTYSFQLGGSKHSTVSPPAAQAVQQSSFRGLPPSPPAAPAASPPGDQQSHPEVEFNETDCAGKAWCVVPDPHRYRTRGPIASTEPPAAPAGGADGPQWYVVEDRRGHVRGNDSQPRQRRQALAKINAKKPYQKLRKNEAMRMSQKKPTASGMQVYLLPQFNGNRVTLRLPEPYQLRNFGSIGIYDSCKKARIASINLRNVQPPKEALLNGLHSSQFDVKSSQIRILNCNSILITNFTYTGAAKTDAYFYIGGGSFPFSITKKMQAEVIGESKDKPLRNYRNKDVLVRLPQGVRTMDITWLSLMSVKGNSYAHVIIPPVIVPPCD